MADIFGKNPQDYKYLMDTKKADKQAYDSLLSKGFNGHKHDFNALTPIDGNRFQWNNFNPHARAQDAASQGFQYFTNNLGAMQAQVDEILYGDFRVPSWLPIKTDIPEGAKFYEQKIVNKYGEAGSIDNYGTNAQTASVSYQIVSRAIDFGGMNAAWSKQDLKSASLSGVALESDTLAAAAESTMQYLERVCLGTDKNKQFEGILNLSTVPTVTAPAQWSTLTADELLVEIKKYIQTIVTNTNEIFRRQIKSKMAIYAPISVASQITDQRPSSASDKTVKELVIASNFWNEETGIANNLEFITIQELATAGAGGTQRVLYGFPTEDRVWEFAIPRYPRIEQIFDERYAFSAPITAEHGGVAGKRTGAMLYVDGV
jgi:hypothetical protein